MNLDNLVINTNLKYKYFSLNKYKNVTKKVYVFSYNVCNYLCVYQIRYFFTNKKLDKIRNSFFKTNTRINAIV